MPIEAIIFDFDGVLVESLDVKTAAFARMYEKYGPETVARSSIITCGTADGAIRKIPHYEKILLGAYRPREENDWGDVFRAGRGGRGPCPLGARGV